MCVQVSMCMIKKRMSGIHSLGSLGHRKQPDILRQTSVHLLDEIRLTINSQTHGHALPDGMHTLIRPSRSSPSNLL